MASTRPRPLESAVTTPRMVQNLRSALGKARMSEQEVRTFRGVVTALSKGRGRVLAKLAAQKAEKAEKAKAEKTDEPG